MPDLPELTAIDKTIDWEAVREKFSVSRPCKCCGKPLNTTQSNRTTCSAVCRTRLYRVRLKARKELEQKPTTDTNGEQNG